VPTQRPALVDESLRAFLCDNVNSFEALEALLLLRRKSGRACTAGEVADALSIGGSDAKDALASLCERRLLQVDESQVKVRFAYSPAETHLEEQVDRLARAYDESRIDVLRAMNANAVERGERALKLFADAFVLGRKKDG
jgi:hypothetical protein